MKTKTFNYLIPLLIFLFFSSCEKFQDNNDSLTNQGTGYLETPFNVLNSMPISTVPPSTGGALPSQYDLSYYMPPVKSQGNQGSCSSWATGYYLKGYQENKENGTGFGQNNSGLYSPAFLFNTVKYSDCNNGSYIYKNLDRLKNIGISTWNSMPYDETDCSATPSSTASNEADCRKILNYGVLYYDGSLTSADFLNATKEFISNDNPVIIGIPVDGNFQNSTPLSNNEYVYSSYDASAYKGGHAVLVVGYNDSKNAFKVINSWGTSWGNNGYFWFDYDLYTQITIEAYTTEDLTISCGGGTISPDSLGNIQFNNLTSFQRFVHIKELGAANYESNNQVSMASNDSRTFFNLEPGIYQFEASNVDLYLTSSSYYSSGQIEVIVDSTVVHNINN